MSILQSIKALYPPYRNRQIQADAFGDETAATILRDQDLSSLSRLFAAIPEKWADRYFYSLTMSWRFPLDALKQWATTEQESADAHLVYGARLLKWAWDARGYGSGEEVSKESWAVFYQRLELAREHLARAAQLNQRDPTPWSLLIMVAVYRRDGADAERGYFQEAIARDPDNWTAHVHRLTGLTQKYQGSHSLMFDFAYDAAAHAGARSLLPILIIKAHLEYWKYLAFFDNIPAAATSHLRENYVQRETLEAYQRSLGSNPYNDREAIFARINAAAWFFALLKRDELRHELMQLDGRMHAIHWRWAGTENFFAKAKTVAGLK